MNPKLLLALALVLSGWPGPVRADEIAGKGLADSGQSFESLLRAAFPGIDLNDNGAILYRTDFHRLPAAQRNQIAVAAARELSLRTTNGLVITRETVDELLYKSAANDTPAEAALRRLHGNNDEKITLLRNLSNDRLISDPGVIEPLINLLDYPGQKTDIRDEAAQVLCQLTRQPYSELYQYSAGEEHSQFVKWWRDWWTKNKNKHPVFDDDVKKTIIARVSAIQKQICLGVAGYGELGYLHPTWVQINYIDPSVIANIEVDTAVLSAVFGRTTSEGETRVARRGQDEVLLRIKAQFETPSLVTNQVRNFGTLRNWSEGRVEQVYREELPGTDIVITVEAASHDGVFAGLVRACLAKPPESMRREIARLIRQLETEKNSAGAASLLVRVGEYSPVIAALTNRNPAIRRNAIIALGDFNHNAAAGAPVKSAVPPLIHLLKTGDQDTRCQVAWALGHVHQEDEATVAALIDAMDDENGQAGSAALAALGEFKTQETIIVPAVIKKLSDPNAAVRAQATRTLGGLGPYRDQELAKAVVAALIKTLIDTDNNVREGAAWALGDNGEAAKEAVPVLLKLANSDDNGLRNQVRAALMHIDFEAAKKAGLVN